MSILDTIVKDTIEEVQKRKLRLPVAGLESMPGYLAPTLPFGKALRKSDLTVIAEIKKASPSKGLIRKDFNPAVHALQYKRYGASAVSVLTEPFHFRGSLEYLESVRKTIDLPLLRKDFIVDPYQLHEARAYGADAVLLIATVLDKHRLTDLFQTAASIGLSCLVEVYDIDELDRIDFDLVDVLGVNNRNLHTFEVNLDHSLKVFREAPDSVIKVAESGISDAKDLAFLRRNGIDAVLIGETFMRARHPGEKLLQMLEQTRALVRHDPGLRLVG